MFDKYHFDPAIALELKCPNKAFMVEFIRWSILYKAQKPDQYQAHEGRYYTWDTQEAWQNRMPWLSFRTIATYLKDIRDSGLVEAESLAPNSHDRTLYYTINVERYEEIRTLHNAKFAQCDNAKFAQSTVQNLHNLPSKTLTKSLTKNKARKVFDPWVIDLASRWLDYAKSESPSTSFNKSKFEESINKMNSKFALTQQQIEYLFAWVQQDDFWKPNAISPVSLFKKSPGDERNKLEKIVLQIKNTPKTHIEKVMETVIEVENEIDDENYAFLRLK